MFKYCISEAEDLRLQFSFPIPFRRTLYEYFCELPMEVLQVYPNKGYHWWMGRAAKSLKALEMRDYILHWRNVKQDVQNEFPREHFETLPDKVLQTYLNTFACVTPPWVYEDQIKYIMQILDARESHT